MGLPVLPAHRVTRVVLLVQPAFLGPQALVVQPAQWG